MIWWSACHHHTIHASVPCTYNKHIHLVLIKHDLQAHCKIDWQSINIDDSISDTFSNCKWLVKKPRSFCSLNDMVNVDINQKMSLSQHWPEWDDIISCMTMINKMYRYIIQIELIGCEQRDSECTFGEVKTCWVFDISLLNMSSFSGWFPMKRYYCTITQLVSLYILRESWADMDSVNILSYLGPVDQNCSAASAKSVVMKLFIVVDGKCEQQIFRTKLCANPIVKHWIYPHPNENCASRRLHCIQNVYPAHFMLSCNFYPIRMGEPLNLFPTCNTTSLVSFFSLCYRVYSYFSATVMEQIEKIDEQQQQQHCKYFKQKPFN